MVDENLSKHFSLLQQEYHKINNKYQSLKNKYDQLSLTTGSNSVDDNFFSNLNKIIRGLYKDKKYSDISIKLQKSIIPGHKIVLEANGGDWSVFDTSGSDEINLENEDQLIGEQLVKWLYLQEFNVNQSHEILWKVIKVAHEHNLISLKSRCESGLISKVTKENCIHFYMKSSELIVENLIKFCCDLIIVNWNDYQPADFNCLEASMLLELLETHSNFPLHEAVKTSRDDVVFLYINENFSQLEELVNVISDENEIILDLALANQRVELCQTLLDNCANLNAVDNNGWSLLHKAILRRDKFSASFLIQNGCHLNPISPDYSQTPLQLISCLSSATEDAEAVSGMNKIAVLLIQNGADVNYVDDNDMTALCLSILSGNEAVMKAILDSGRCTSINGSNSWHTNINKPKMNSNLTRVTSHISVSPLPLWLAICREYQPELIQVYKEYNSKTSMSVSPTSMLIESEADPGSLYDSETGNSIMHEVISHNMEEAAIFILESLNNKCKGKESATHNTPSIETLINVTNNLKESLLHIAVENELENLCRILLQLRADPNLVRRKPLNIFNSSSKDELSSSCDSITSYASLKDDFELNIANEISKPVPDASSDSIVSSWSSKGDDLNPFKEFMTGENGGLNSISLSLPTIRKSNPTRCLFVDLVHNKKQTLEHSKSSHRCKTKKVNTEKQVAVDLCSPTHLAIKSKNMNIINLFIYHESSDGCQINWLINDFSGDSPFTLTLWNGLIPVADKIFQKLIKNDFKTSQIDQIIIYGQRLLHLALLKSNMEAVQFLVKIGCDINIRSDDGMTPLQLATEKLNIDIVKILCLSGADPNIIHDNGSSEKTAEFSCPLWVALINHRLDIAEILIEAGADVDMWFTDPGDNYEQNLLHRAILEKREDEAMFLISHDCDVRSPRENKTLENNFHKNGLPYEYTDGDTPLHMACQLGLSEVVNSLLLTADVNVDAQNALGLTPIHLAILHRKESVLLHLLDPKYKVNLSIRDNDGRTPFRTAMEMANQKAAGCILKHYPHAADETDNSGHTFLHLAVQTINKEAVFFLIQVKADLNVRVKDPFQLTPLQLAIISGAPEDMIRSLILAGAHIEDETIEKQNLLHLAVSHERTYLINFLLENGASTSHQDNNREIPLHLAIRGGQASLIEPLLINSSSSIKTKNLKGENVLHILSNNVKENSVVIFSMIMEHYPDFPVDDKDACGNTALFLSACNANIRLGSALLMKGSSLGCVNNEGFTIFNCEQISQQTIIQLLESLDSEPNWKDGDICVSCFNKFSITNRKHHCRHCGRLLCGKCSINEIPIVKYSIKKSVRVCDICFNFLLNGKLS